MEKHIAVAEKLLEKITKIEESYSGSKNIMIKLVVVLLRARESRKWNYFMEKLLYDKFVSLKRSFVKSNEKQEVVVSEFDALRIYLQGTFATSVPKLHDEEVAHIIEKLEQLRDVPEKTLAGYLGEVLQGITIGERHDMSSDVSIMIAILCSDDVESFKLLADRKISSKELGEVICKYYKSTGYSLSLKNKIFYMRDNKDLGIIVTKGSREYYCVTAINNAYSGAGEVLILVKGY